MLGGTYELTNFRPIVAVEAMQYRADIATQLRGVPDGTQVILKVVDYYQGVRDRIAYLVQRSSP